MGRIYRRGRVLHGYWTDPEGNPHRRSLRTEDPTVARARLRQLELATTDPAAYSGHTLGQAFDALFVAMASSPAATVSSYQQKARHVERLLGRDVELARLTRDDLVGYVRTRLEEGAHAGTVHKEMVVVRRALKEAAARGLWKGEPGSLVPRIKAQYRPRDRWLTREQGAALLAVLPLRRRLWAAIALFAGLRDSEVEGLLWEHVDGEEGWLRAPGTKTTGAWRMIPIAPELAALLADAAAAAKDAGATGRTPVVVPWASVRRDLPRALDRALRDGRPRKRLPKGERQPPYPKLTPNDLRRTFASWLVQAGVPLLVVARLLGHSSTRMVERVYGHLSQASYRDAIDRTFGCAAGVQHAFPQQGSSGGAGTSPILQIVNDVAEVVVPSPGIEPGTRGFSGRFATPGSLVIPLRSVPVRR